MTQRAPLMFRRDHVFRTVAPADFGRWPVRFTDVAATWVGREIRLPPADDRKKPEFYAAVAQWCFDFPHVTPLTDRFVLYVVSLRDIKGVPPATKQFGGATHEIGLFAVSPETTAAEWKAGRYAYMTPINYCEQFTTPYDHVATWVAERAAEAFVCGRFVVEPGGCRGAREHFAANVREWERQAKSVFKPLKKPRPGDHPENPEQEPEGE